MFFFVLSGYVVAFTVESKKNRVRSYTFGVYFIERWSRIYSVLLPAVLFTLTIDFLGSFYSAYYSNQSFVPQDMIIVRFLINVLALQGWQGMRVQLGSNPALWSIGYEFFYYVVFGLLVFFRQTFRNTVIGVCVLTALIVCAGLDIVLYGLIWAAGASAYYLSNRSNVTIKWPIFYLIGSAIFLFMSNHFIVYEKHFFTSEYYNDLALGLILSLLLFPEYSQVKIPNIMIRVNKFLADFSFSLYASHMPVIFCVLVILKENDSWIVHDPAYALLFCGAISMILAYLFYLAFESRRSYFKVAAEQIVTAVTGIMAKAHRD